MLGPLTRQRLLPWPGLLVLWLATQFVRWPEPLGLDQSLFACLGLWLPQGAMPYQDLWDSKPPAIFYLYALTFDILGPHVASVRVLDGLATGAGAVALFFLGRHFGRQAGLWAAAAYLLFAHLPNFGGLWGSAQAETFIGPLVVVALLGVVGSRRHPLVLFAAGFLVGLAGLFKVPALLFVLPFLLYLILGKNIRALLWFLGGVPVLPLAVVLYFWGQGSLGLFYEAVFTYAKLYREAVSPPQYWPLAWQVFADFVAQDLLFWGLSTISAAGLVFSFLHKGGEGGWEDRRLLVLVLSWWGCAYAMVWGQGQFATYHFLVLLAPSALLIGCGVHRIVCRLLRAGTHRWFGFLVLAGILLAAWRDAPAYIQLYGPNVRFLSGRINEDAFFHLSWKGATAPGRDREIGRYIAARTTPDQRILVWGLVPAIYFQAARRPATRYLFHHHLLTDAPVSLQLPGLEQRQAEFMQGLQQDKPVFILVGRGDRNIFEPRDSYEQMRRFPAFHRFVRQHYVPDQGRDGLLIYRRRQVP